MIKAELLEKLISFRRERDWEQFHNPKDIAISLSIEAAELLEWFQWRTNEDIAAQLSSDKRQDLEDEIADVAVYLSYLCHDLGIDINKVVAAKIDKNALKYPVDKVKGRADKYNEY
ncbi:MAG: nucleotide pyrophosphohydrolase [Methylophaga sp.]|nr:MAG: nucleotide pyrophosphohydrolase [Methylophaga sp.]